MVGEGELALSWSRELLAHWATSGGAGSQRAAGGGGRFRACRRGGVEGDEGTAMDARAAGGTV